MSRKRYKPEQIINLLREAEVALSIPPRNSACRLLNLAMRGGDGLISIHSSMLARTIPCALPSTCYFTPLSDR